MTAALVVSTRLLAVTLTCASAMQLIGSSSKEEQKWWPFSSGGSGSDPDATHKQTLENHDDVSYFGMMKIGGQQVKAVIDTGSFELLVMGKNCTKCGDPSHLYDESKSAAYNGSHFEATHSFGSGITYSYEAHDQIQVGHLSVPVQSFWEVVDADMYILADGGFQAIFGVGPPQSAVQFAKDDKEAVQKELRTMKKAGNKITPRIKDIVQHYDDLVEYMKSSTSVMQNLGVENMSICLGQSSGSSGYFYWNDHASRDNAEKFATVPVQGETYWSAMMEDVVFKSVTAPDGATKKQRKSLEGVTEIGCKSKKCSAVVDTGTSLIVAPTAAAEQVYDLADKWEAAGGTCDDLSQLPDLTFSLGGITMSLPPQSYMAEVSGDLSEEMAALMPRLHNKLTNRNVKDDGAEFGVCEPLVMTMDAETEFGDTWIMGMPFFRKYYTSFHFTKGSGAPVATAMSFSEADHHCQPGAAPGTPQSNLQAVKKMPGVPAGVDADTRAEILPTKDAGSTLDAGRRAQLRVDASKLLTPSMVKKNHLLKTSSSMLERSPKFHI